MKTITDHAATMVFIVFFKLLLLHTTGLLSSPYEYVFFIRGTTVIFFFICILKLSVFNKKWSFILFRLRLWSPDFLKSGNKTFWPNCKVVHFTGDIILVLLRVRYI